MSPGQTIGFRGPYGNHFPVDDWKGKDLVFIGGGIGMAALRSAMLEALDRKAEFGDIVILNGARSVADMVYKEEMPAWQEVEEGAGDVVLRLDATPAVRGRLRPEQPDVLTAALHLPLAWRRVQPLWVVGWVGPLFALYRYLEVPEANVSSLAVFLIF